MKSKVLSVISKYSMIQPGDRVFVGLSGGADSVSLLHVLNSIKDELHFSLCAAHVNHQIRGAEAERDELFVKKLCQSLSVQLYVGSFNIPEISKSTGESLELCGRRIRYEFFNSICDNAKIATAHNLNDSAETFFLNLSRGAGLNGLCGIPPVRENIIRPLIECSRAEIEKYCHDNELEFVTDSTNLCDDYTRNQIRHHILPVMTDINPAFLDIFLRTTDSLKEDMLYIESECNRIYSQIADVSCVGCDIFLSLPDSIRNRLLAKLIRENTTLSPEARHIKLISSFISDGHGAVMLSDTWTASVNNNRLVFVRRTVREKAPEVNIEIVPGVMTYETQLGVVTFVLLDKKKSQLKKNIKELSLDNFADYDKIIMNSVIRTRRNSDRFKFPLSAHSSSLKNLFRDRGIDSFGRQDKLYIADGEHILWSETFGVSDYAAVNSDTKRIIKINFRRKHNA